MTESPESQPDSEQNEASGPPETEPRGNPEPDADEVERSEEGLDQVSGN
jgi:hypothetical protein